MPVFELACVVIVAATLVTMARVRGARAVVVDYLLLAVAGWIGEQTCIEFYEFYRYAPTWHGRIGHVPVLVPLIWPLVILSAREVATAVSPALGWRRSALVAALVIFDASLVEVVAVRAGLWQWAEPGHLAVPVIGILGWGYFALFADAVLESGRGLAKAMVLVIAPIGAHVLIFGSWWLLFRWAVRGDLGDSSVIGVAALGVLATVGAGWLRRADRMLALSTAVPRLIAASLFIALLLATAPADWRLWLHTAAVGIPYNLATRYWRPASIPA